MANQTEPHNNQSSDEIDLGQLLQLIKKGINGLGDFLLRIYLYLRNRALKIAGLIVIGLLISFGLSQIISKTLKTEVIVRPNFESKNYVYDVVAEIAANISGRNADFLKEIDVVPEDLAGFKVQIEAIEDDDVKTDDRMLQEMKYLEVLQNFKDESFVMDILRAELSEKSEINHKITFTYKDPEKGPAIVQKLMDYIEANEYFNQVKTVYSKNAQSRIEKNKTLIQQIDQLVDNYSKALLTDKQKSGAGMVYMEKENTLNVPSLLSMKNVLVKEIEEKQLELAQQTEIISVLNLGNTQVVKKSFFTQTYFSIPSILVGGYLVISFFQYLERRSKRLKL